MTWGFCEDSEKARLAAVVLAVAWQSPVVVINNPNSHAEPAAGSVRPGRTATLALSDSVLGLLGDVGVQPDAAMSGATPSARHAEHHQSAILHRIASSNPPRSMPSKNSVIEAAVGSDRNTSPSSIFR